MQSSPCCDVFFVLINASRAAAHRHQKIEAATMEDKAQQEKSER